MRRDQPGYIGTARRTGNAPDLYQRAGHGTTVVPGQHVDHAADGVRPIQRRPLRPANHLDAVHDVGIELGDQQWIRDLDAVDVDLRRTRSK